MASVPPSRCKLVLVSADDLDSVKLDDDERLNDATTLMELLQPAVADQAVEALRRILTITFGRGDSRSSEVLVADIRGIAMKPLGRLGKELDVLKLPRVDADRSFERDNSAQICTHLFVSPKELRRRVQVPGRRHKQRLNELFQHLPADPILVALRRTLSMTFTEATTPNQHDRVLEDIRYLTAASLVPCNPILEIMELEPVAMPTWRRFVDGVDTLDGSDVGDDDDEPAP